MKNVFRIFSHDIYRITHNAVAFFVVIGVLFFPSVYAWFNIYANMDPYSNTQGIPVAVANCDTMVTHELTGAVCIGNQIEEGLRENDSLGWVFLSHDEAIAGVKSGKYYAALVIPENFSECMISILSGTLDAPTIEYYVNEKKNAVAPKVTDTGATTIQQQINATFVSVASEEVAKKLEQILADVDDADTLRAEDAMQSLRDANRILKEQQDTIQIAVKSIDDNRRVFTDTYETLNQLELSATKCADSVDTSLESLSAIRKSTADFSSAINQQLTDTRRIFNNLDYELSTGLRDAQETLSALEQEVNAATAKGRVVIQKNRDAAERLETEWNQLPLPNAPNVQAPDGANQRAEALLDEADAAVAAIREISDDVSAYHKNISQALTAGSQELTALYDSFNGEELGSFRHALDQLAFAGGQLSASLRSLDESLSGMRSLLSELEYTTNQTSDVLLRTVDTLARISNRVTQAETDILALQNLGEYEREKWLPDTESLSATDLANYVSAPVELVTVSNFYVENYGSGMTPFYTTLAIWVSGLILVALFKMEIDAEEKKRINAIQRLTLTESYFGRLMIFLLVGMIQTWIICAGNIWLLKVQCDSIPRFFFAATICSFVFINLIYALSITFKHIGKALCVLLLIIQIPGSSGTYPIEMTPLFFQTLHPVLPFSYAINAFREAMFGTYGTIYSHSLCCVISYFVIALFIGLVVRPGVINLNHLTDRKLHETGLIICEEDGMTVSRYRTKTAMRILTEHDATHEIIQRRTAQFERIYQTVERYRIGIVLILPQIFLIIMFVVASSMKLVFLGLWIAALLLLASLLLFMEYTHETLQENLRLANLPEQELWNTMKEERT